MVGGRLPEAWTFLAARVAREFQARETPGGLVTTTEVPAGARLIILVTEGSAPWPRGVRRAPGLDVLAYALLWPTQGPARIAVQLRQPRCGGWRVSTSGGGLGECGGPVRKRESPGLCRTDPTTTGGCQSWDRAGYRS
jgi:hypothetical protein